MGIPIHHHRAIIVQSYLPSGANEHPQLKHGFLGPYKSATQLDRFGHFCRLTSHFPYSHNIITSKIIPSLGDFDPSNTLFFVPTFIVTTNGISVASITFAAHMVVTGNQ